MRGRMFSLPLSLFLSSSLRCVDVTAPPSHAVVTRRYLKARGAACRRPRERDEQRYECHAPRAAALQKMNMAIRRHASILSQWQRFSRLSLPQQYCYTSREAYAAGDMAK